MSNNIDLSQKQIRIYINDRKLYLISRQRADKIYPIAVGKPGTPTPTGTFHIINKTVNPGGMLGTRWMGLDIPNGPYGIHGTFQPDSIGKAISNGCIRLYNSDIEELFSLSRIGTTVVIESFIPGQDGLGFSYYTVQPGDTLWSIAQNNGVTVDELIKLNDITNPDNLQIGQQIKLPKKQ